MTAQEWMDENGLKAGDRVRVAKSDSGWIHWFSGLDRFIGGEYEIQARRGFGVTYDDDCIGLSCGWYFRPCSLELMDKPDITLASEYVDSPFPTLAEFLS